MKTFPFNEYDSIYIANPNFIKDVNEPRNYLDRKFYNQIRMISSIEKERLSNILLITQKKIFSLEQDYLIVLDAIVFRKNIQKFYYYLKEMENSKNLLHSLIMEKIGITLPIKNINISIGQWKKEI